MAFSSNMINGSLAWEYMLPITKIIMINIDYVFLKTFFG